MPKRKADEPVSLEAKQQRQSHFTADPVVALEADKCGTWDGDTRNIPSHLIVPVNTDQNMLNRITTRLQCEIDDETEAEVKQLGVDALPDMYIDMPLLPYNMIRVRTFLANTIAQLANPNLPPHYKERLERLHRVLDDYDATFTAQFVEMERYIQMFSSTTEELYEDPFGDPREDAASFGFYQNQ